MKLHGYCTSCHKIKLVQVSGQGMAMLAARGAPQGTCDACRQAEDDKRTAVYVIRSTNPASGNSQVMRQYTRNLMGRREVVVGPWTRAEAEKIAQYLAMEEGIGDAKRLEPRLRFTVERTT